MQVLLQVPSAREGGLVSEVAVGFLIIEGGREGRKEENQSPLAGSIRVRTGQRGCRRKYQPAIIIIIELGTSWLMACRIDEAHAVRCVCVWGEGEGGGGTD